MKKLIGVLVLAFFALGLTAQSALADATTVTFSGSFTSDSNFSEFSTPGGTFSISFLVPSSFPAGPFGALEVAVTTSDDNPASVLPGLAIFRSTALGGLFQFDVTEGSVTYIWTANGPQIYTLNSTGTTATLIPSGMFVGPPATDMFSGNGSNLFDTNGDISTISNGVVILTSSIPEPTALYLLPCGLLALATLRRKFLLS